MALLSRCQQRYQRIVQHQCVTSSAPVSLHFMRIKRPVATVGGGYASLSPAKIHPETTSTTSDFSTMITIYHNPRCSKSRAACELVATTYNTTNEATEIVEYLKQPLTVPQLKQLNAKLGCTVREMLRDTETEYKELQLSDASLTDAQLYEALARHPILLQRPIVVRDGRAVIGRPPENVAALFA